MSIGKRQESTMQRSALNTTLPAGSPLRAAAREMSRRHFLGMSTVALAGAISLDSLLAACTPSSGSNKPTGTLVLATQTLATEQWAVWLAGNDEEVVTHFVGETLLRNNPTTRVLEPNLAESWQLSSDGLTWSFKLRPNIPFHDGWGMLTAEDVKYTFASLIRPDSTAGLGPLVSDAMGGSIDGFEIVNSLEFRLHAKTPLVTFANYLTDGTVGPAIQSKKYWDSIPASQYSTAKPIGTGPYKFTGHTPGVEVTFDAVENHWRKTPAFKQLVLKIISNDATRLAQVESGQVDFAIIPISLKSDATGAGLRIASIKTSGVCFVVFGGMYTDDLSQYDTTAPWIQAANPAAGLAVRQALNIAVDRQAILDKILFGEGELCAAPTAYPPGYGFDDPSWKVASYDPARAKSLLAQGGYPNGFTVNFPEFAEAGRPVTPAIGEAVAGMWEAVGLTVKRQPMDYKPTWFAKVKARTTKGLCAVHSGPFYDEPLDTFKSAYMPTSNVRYYGSTAIDQAVAQMATEPDQAKRFAIARTLGQSLIDDVTSVALVTFNGSFAVGSKVKSWLLVNGNGELHNPEYMAP